MFIPLYDGKPVVNIYMAFVNWGIILINIAAFFVFQAHLGIQESAYQAGLIPAVINNLAELPEGLALIPENVTFISYAFLHGDFMHLLGNMLFLWVFGDNVEDAMGHLKYVVFYALCAIAAGIAHNFYFYSSTMPLIGASGAVAGIIAAYLMLHPKMRIWVLVFGKIPLPISAFWCLGAWIAFQLYQFLYSPESQVSWIAHIAGFITGLILIPIFKNKHIFLFDKKISHKF